MPEIPVEQAICSSDRTDVCSLLARSPGFVDDWQPEAQRLCAGFGSPPTGVSCSACIFAQPFGKKHVAVVHAADGIQPGTLLFHFLVVLRTDYETSIGDPFALADRFPPPWQARGELPQLTWPAEPLPRRIVAEVQRILKSPDGPLLLGSVQALVDGGRLVFEHSRPDPDLIRGLWMLLPTSTRCTLWPATFAFGGALGFDAIVVPRADSDAFAGYVTEEVADAYPQGRYELNLQIAAEDGDQAELDRLFARRSRAQMWRLGLWLLAAVLILAIGSKFLAPTKPPPPAATQAKEKP